METNKIKVGDRVRLTKRPECGEAVVVIVDADGIPGGIRLDKPLGGTRTWYHSDFEVYRGESESSRAFIGDALPTPRESVRIRILESLRLDGAATCEEMVSRLGLRHQCVSGRFSELKRAGDIVPTGERQRTGTGAQATVFRIALDLGDDEPADYPGKAADVKSALESLRGLL